ncbi:odorant receptor 67c isoform X3 [Plodia interpunctella]|uniref:odorant receptor 67c isoform X3 n=1 Tax=Plodia interpunctella TaxID=58824 RepID=UPI0023676A40|nr:odorant receptor 67c-like isoform X3 [Plodia interpunctella]
MDDENNSHTQPIELQTLDESLGNISLPCRLVGLNIEARERKLKDNLVYWFNMIWMNLALVACFYWTYKRIVEGEDITEITYVAPGAILSIIGDFKGIFSLAYENETRLLLANLRRLEKNINVNKLTEMELDIAKSSLIFLNRVVKIMNVLNIMMLLMYDLSPIVLMATMYYKTGTLELILPFLDIYPFDSFDLRIYPFLYFHQIWSEAIVLFQVCSADFLFYTCCTYLYKQFTHLQYQFADIISQNEVKSNPDELRQNFTILIKWHQDLISNALKLEVITSKSVLSNFLMSSLVICLTGFNITTTDDFSAIMTFMTFLFMSLIQVFFLCLFGDLLMKSSSDVSDAAYNYKWYLSHVSTGKNILLIQTRSQTPCKITAAGFADVNLRAYTKNV